MALMYCYIVSSDYFLSFTSSHSFYYQQTYVAQVLQDEKSTGEDEGQASSQDEEAVTEGDFQSGEDSLIENEVHQWPMPGPHHVLNLRETSRRSTTPHYTTLVSVCVCVWIHHSWQLKHSFIIKAWRQDGQLSRIWSGLWLYSTYKKLAHHSFIIRLCIVCPVRTAFGQYQISCPCKRMSSK